MVNNSAKTSLNQVPALHKKIEWTYGQFNLDIGGGKYDTATTYLSSMGVNNFVYDPYNRPKEHNTKVLSRYIYDSATIANVLNVIENEDEKIRALRTAMNKVKSGGKVYISIYEGTKSGVSTTSSIGTYQENRKLKTYLNEVHQVWTPDLVKIKRNFIEVTNG